jgi:hypothetical protein
MGYPISAWNRHRPFQEHEGKALGVAKAPAIRVPTLRVFGEAYFSDE